MKYIMSSIVFILVEYIISSGALRVFISLLQFFMSFVTVA